jgi:hypothetical protein
MYDRLSLSREEHIRRSQLERPILILGTRSV